MSCQSGCTQSITYRCTFFVKVKAVKGPRLPSVHLKHFEDVLGHNLPWAARNYVRYTFKIVAIVAQWDVSFWYSANLYLLIGRGLPLSRLWPFWWTFNLSIWQEGMFHHSIRSTHFFGYGIHSWPTVEGERAEREREKECKALKTNAFHWLIS